MNNAEEVGVAQPCVSRSGAAVLGRVVAGRIEVVTNHLHHYAVARRQHGGADRYGEVDGVAVLVIVMAEAACEALVDGDGGVFR